jgi:hypothetical protein
LILKSWGGIKGLEDECNGRNGSELRLPLLQPCLAELNLLVNNMEESEELGVELETDAFCDAERRLSI